MSEADENLTPDAGRAARRGCVLYALATRAMFETMKDVPLAKASQANLIEWLTECGATDELESKENLVLRSDHGSLDERTRLSCSWEYESAAVIAWSLGRLDLPPVDCQVSDVDLGDTLVNHVADQALPLRDSAVIRSYESLMYNLHWRSRHEMSHPGAYNLRGMLLGTPAIPGVSGIRFAQDDLQVDDAPIFRAALGRRQEVNSIISTRRHAASWLCGDHTVYSEVSLDT